MVDIVQNTGGNVKFGLKNELKILVGDVLGDGRDEIARCEYFKVTVNLLVHAGAVNHGAIRVGQIGSSALHLIDGEGARVIAD